MSYNITELEAQFLEAFTLSDFYDGAESKVWDFSVHENLKLKGKARGGVISSLMQKGILEIRSKSQNGGIAPSYNISAEALKSAEITKFIK